MQSPVRIADETYLLPTSFPMPGFGTFYVNAMIIRGQEPILVETGAPVFRDDYLERAFSIVDPKDVRWIFLSHDDRDHSGNIMQVLDACPNAELVTNFVGVGRMSEEWELPMPRLHFVNDGETFSAGAARWLPSVPLTSTHPPPAVCGTPPPEFTSPPTPLAP